MINNIGRYEIVDELGRGAMGIVYKANDPLLDRQVALKTINLQNLPQDERKEYEARFYQEAKAAGRLNHPNIVIIYDIGEYDKIAYIAMEMMEGYELQNRLKDGQYLPVEEMVNIAIQVTKGMAFAHEHGIVHRDLKPSNIMVLKNGQVKIADFGIARVPASLVNTQDGRILGSPMYMSPEQILERPLDARSDIFSMGITLFQALTGKMPFKGDNAHSVMYRIVQDKPPKARSLNPEIPEMLDAIIARCLAKNPEDRYQSATELGDALRTCRNKLRGQASFDDTSIFPAVRHGKKGKWKLIGAAIVLIILFEVIEQLFFHS
jgi:eukaryotic-like serine/threonine-protein kinase